MNQNFTQGKILRPLLRFAFPVLLALFLQTLYGAVDMIVVGRYCSSAEVSAVSTGSVIMQTLTIVITGLSMGTTILLGQRLGEGRSGEMGDVVGGSVCLFSLIGLVLAIAMQWLAPACVAAMRTPAEASASAESYVMICSAGAPFIVGYNVLGSIFRGMGNSQIPLIAVAIACAANIFGDVLLVGYFRMGAAGAAAATVGAQALSVLLSILIIRRQALPFSFGWKNLRFHSKVLRRVVWLGLPIAFQDMLVSLSFLAITAIINLLGVVASAGVGVAERICGFIMLVPSAYMQAMSAFTAQNIGAGLPGRAKKALLYAVLSSLGAGVVMSAVSYFYGDFLAGLFVSGQPDVVAAGAEYLAAYSIDCVLVSFLFCFIGYFNGCGKTPFVMWQGIIGAFGVRIPLSYLMSRLIPISIFKIGLATPASTVVQIALCGAYFAYMNRKKHATVR